MSTVVRPSGPLPPRVYWVRRLLLLAVVAALVWGVVRVVGGGDPANGEPAGEPAAATDTVTSEAPADDVADRRTKLTPRQQRRRERISERAELRRSKLVRDVAQTLEAPSGPCDLTLVRLVPQVLSPAYAGASVPLRLGLRTQQATSCTIDLDDERLLVSISSVEQVVADGVTSEATEIVWSTAECGDAVPLRTVVLRPSWTSTVDLSWSGLRGGRRCRPDAKPVDAGSYRLQAAALTGEPAAVDFDLVDPPSVNRRVDEPGSQDDPDPDAAGAQDEADEDAGEEEQVGGDADQPAGPSGDDEQAGPDADVDQNDSGPPQT